jgi:hypothetical protein
MRFSQRIYRLLLRAYPESYRRHYEEPMAQLFADQLRVADTWSKLAALWLRTLADLLRTLPARHADTPASWYGLGRVASFAHVLWSQASRHAIFFAREEASSFGRREITPEHMVLGILREAQAMPELGPVRDEIVREIEGAENGPRRVPPMEDLLVSRPLRGILSGAKDVWRGLMPLNVLCQSAVDRGRCTA